MPNPAIRAHRDQRCGVLEGQIGALSSRGRRSANHLEQPEAFYRQADGNYSKNIGSQLPPTERVTPPQRSVPQNQTQQQLESKEAVKAVSAYIFQRPPRQRQYRGGCGEKDNDAQHRRCLPLSSTVRNCASMSRRAPPLLLF